MPAELLAVHFIEETALATEGASLPRYLEQSSQLIEVLRKLSPNQLAELMKLSDKLAGLKCGVFNAVAACFYP